jgi:hypothetical protein
MSRKKETEKVKSNKSRAKEKWNVKVHCRKRTLVSY